MIDINQTTRELERRLDGLESTLPAIPARAVALGRASGHRIAAAANDVVASAGDAATDVGRRLADLSSDVNNALATTIGQTRSATARAADTARRNSREASGQAQAQARRTARSAGQTADALLDDATRAIEPADDGRPAALEQWTKADLYERAQELDIDGRSSMSKKQLVRAIRSAN
jgi:hypothetical protein